MISRKRARRKETGGLYLASRKRRLSELGRTFTATLLGKNRIKTDRVRGGIEKNRLLSAETITVFEGNKATKATIKSVVENPANRNFARRNIITKGSILDTEQGKVRVTSRPGQTAGLSGVLIK